VLAELEAESQCLPHFLMAVEQACADMRRETALGDTRKERRAEVIAYIAKHGELLARAATSGVRMPDELKGRILSAFLTLMNLRENVDRAAERARGIASR
jgi:hypothetical protein